MSINFFSNFIRSTPVETLAYGVTGAGITIAELHRRPFQLFGFVSWSLLVGFVAGGHVARDDTQQLSEAVNVACFATMGLGWMLRVWAMRTLGPAFTVRADDSGAAKDGVVVRSGPYGWIRHPAYLSFALAFGPAALVVSQNPYYGWAITGIICLLYGRVVSRMEEEKLCEAMPDYKKYMEEVRFRLLPGIL